MTSKELDRNRIHAFISRTEKLRYWLAHLEKRVSAGPAVRSTMRPAGISSLLATTDPDTDFITRINPSLHVRMQDAYSLFLPHWRRGHWHRLSIA